ncbi:hypothetical protein [Williamsia phyllosphaerae]|uniref:hypothetical protein n=1 Tax=Williamsia phyllosphaerae TaxID=885042 RepID=UPI00280A9527|nr:hypothetical protein [Williamsia phyllosphaerae]
MHPQGCSEISAVCTDPRFCRRGLSARLVRADGTRDPGARRGPVPARPGRQSRGDPALRIAGFTLRKRSVLTSVRTPAVDPLL